MQHPGSPTREAVDFYITLYDEQIIHYVFDTDIFLQKKGTTCTRVLNDEWETVPLEARPALALGTRIYVDESASVRFCPPLWEPTLSRFPAGVQVRRVKREVAVAGYISVLWSLLRLMDGQSTMEELLAQFPDSQFAINRLIALLASAGVIDVSGRQIGRFLHAATKNEVLPGGGLDATEVALLVMDGNYRTYPHAQQLPVQNDVPASLAPLQTIIRARRSHETYTGKPVARNDLDAMLTTACGVTGVLEWNGRELKLRAYPSGGGLYAVEIYPVVFAVEGLEAGIYHYRPTENVLEIVRTGIDRTSFVNVAVPIQRDMIQGVAAIICLTGAFNRFERKYGEGGYRILAAEAGHISENLILAATALHLHARPCGGFVEELLNIELGLATDAEQFLLSVVVGYADIPDSDDETT